MDPNKVFRLKDMPDSRFNSEWKCSECRALRRATTAAIKLMPECEMCSHRSPGWILIRPKEEVNMPLFIAKDYDGKISDVVLAHTVELAHAYWHGKDVTPHTVTSKSDQDLVDHPTGVLPIVSTRKITVNISGHSAPKEIRMID